MMTWRIRLADNWRDLHRKSTVIAGTTFAAITGFGPTLLDAWHALPDDLKSALPEGTARWVSMAAFVLMIGFRYTKIERVAPEGGQ
jgi:hypothetical protein